jgi:adenylate cyclase
MGVVRIGYPDRRQVRVAKGTTILEASQQHRIPHASVCGGRGRCSTCRVRVLQGGEALPAPSDAEAAVLLRVRAAPGVRLACQTRPQSDLDVVPLLPPTATPRDARPQPGATQGEERELAVLFADLRSFTQLAEKKLPYDVVFVLNRYYRGMAAAIEGAGGHVDKFIGDGVMALFGLTTDSRKACRQAIRAAEAMTAELAEINRSLQHELPVPLRIGIGIHVGPAIVGEMGAGGAVSLTAVGDTVNTASRIEALTKDFDAELVLSAVVAEAAGYAPAGARRESTTVRGRSQPLALLVIGKVNG